MPITTIFRSEFYLSDSLQIFKEWMSDYINFDEIDFSYDSPFFNENHILLKPLVYIQVMPGSNRRPIGMGKVINQTQKGQMQGMELMCWIYVNNSVGGSERCRSIAEKIQWNFMTNGHLLDSAGLDNPQISSLREYPPDSYSKIFGGRMLITWKCLLRYDG